jgi:hypothetical protein
VLRFTRLAILSACLAAIVAASPAQACTPETCSQLKAACGLVSDGCGGTINCPNSCSAGQMCDANKCCTPKTSCPAGTNCGLVSNGCGGNLHCGTCPVGKTCGSTHVCE